MQLISFLLLFLSAVLGVQAVDVQKSFLVYFQPDAPQSAIDEAKQIITDAKGVITHEYTIIRGFAATAGEKVYESLQVWTQSNDAIVEEDKIISLWDPNQ